LDGRQAGQNITDLIDNAGSGLVEYIAKK